MESALSDVDKNLFVEVTATHKVKKPGERGGASDCLLIASGPLSGTMIALRPPMVIGRAPTCDYVIQDPSISRTHARVIRDGDGQLHIYDLDTTNGTKLNGQSITNGPLNDGDRVAIGDIILFKISASAVTTQPQGPTRRREPSTTLNISRDGHMPLSLENALSVFEDLSSAMILTDRTGTIQRVNHAFTQVTGYSQEEAIGNNPRMLQSGRHGSEFYAKLWDQLTTTGHWQGEVWNRRKSGEIYPEWLSIAGLRDENGAVVYYLATFSDISEAKRVEEEVRHMAYHDPLTGLANRLLFDDRLEHALARAQRYSEKLALLYIDLDRFKPVNDDHGHAVGDEVLLQVAKRLKNTIRESDTAARIGGDEFAAILDGLCEETAPIIAERVVTALSRPYEVHENTIEIGASVGVAVFPRDAIDMSSLIKAADAAMYIAKKTKRSGPDDDPDR